MRSTAFLARRVIMASYIYYRHSETIVSDRKFDRWCQIVADEWDDLDRFLRWQLGTPQDIRATGMHVRVTLLAEHAAFAWFKERMGYRLKSSNAVAEDEWRWSEKRQVRWVPAGR